MAGLTDESKAWFSKVIPVVSGVPSDLMKELMEEEGADLPASERLNNTVRGRSGPTGNGRASQLIRVHRQTDTCHVCRTGLSTP